MCKEFPSAPGIPWDLSYSLHYHDLTAAANALPVIGVIPRDQEMVYVTNWAPVRTPDPDVRAREVSRWTLLAGLEAALLLVLWLAGGSPLSQGLLRWPVVSALLAVCFIAGLRTSDSNMPAWLVAGGGGVISCLMAMDLLFSATGRPGLRSRIFGSLLLLLIAAVLVHAPWPMNSRGTSTQVLTFLAPVLVAIAALAGLAGKLPASPVPRALRQLLALVWVLATLSILLDVIGVSVDFFNRAG